MLVLALWSWLAGVVLGAAAAGFAGAPVARLSEAAALALSPSVAGLVLGSHKAGRTHLGFVLVWLVSAAGLVAGTGGAASPAVALFMVPLALTVLLRRAWAAEVGAGAAVAFAGACALALEGRGEALSPFPEILAVLAIAFSAALIALGQAARATREGAAGRQIAEVSHELRTPLTHIIGFAEMIEQRLFGALNERYGEYARLIRQSGNHLLELVNDLLDLSRIEAGRYGLERERFDARAIAEEVVRLSADAAARKRIVLAVSGPAALLTVHADPRALRRMLFNLIGNALKFTPEGGRVEVGVSAAGADFVLEVADTGPGIAAAERSQLGVAYVRGSAGAGSEGAGLGLSLVRALAALHGGGLSFHDAPGGGALVRVRLPVLVAA